MATPNGKNRRTVLAQGSALIGAAAGVSLVSAFIPGCEKDTVKSTNEGIKVDISGEDDLKIEGGVVQKTFADINSGKPVLIFRKSEKEFLVLSAVCTHQGCIVETPASIDEDIVCNCHGSHFSTVDGSVKTGSATASLKRFPAGFDARENVLTIEI